MEQSKEEEIYDPILEDYIQNVQYLTLKYSYINDR